MRFPVMRTLGGAATAAAAVLLLAGCGSLAIQPTRTPTVTVAPTAPAPVSTPTPRATPTPSETVTVTANPEPTTSAAATDPDRPANQCPDSALGVSMAPAAGGGAAGSESIDVFITNTGGSTCVLRGAPGVSVVDAKGAQLGQAAARVQTAVSTVTLKDGQTAVASLRIVDIGTDGGPLAGCTVQKGVGYLVYPPHSKKGFAVPDAKAVACAPGPVFMTVNPVKKPTG